ncbi:hypothetical protein BH11ARM1_BH11ARM1_05390 [soil metagenome]
MRVIVLVKATEESMDEAVEWVKRCPKPMSGPSEIEIRPIEEDLLSASTSLLSDRILLNGYSISSRSNCNARSFVKRASQPNTISTSREIHPDSGSIDVESCIGTPIRFHIAESAEAPATKTDTVQVSPYNRFKHTLLMFIQSFGYGSSLKSACRLKHR